jgi:hypothetical protein
MTRKTLLALSAAFALSTLVGHHASAQNPITPETNILAEENRREAALDSTFYQRPTQQISYTVWYKGSRMNYYAVYQTTSNVRVAWDTVMMLQNRGFSSFFTTNYN